MDPIQALILGIVEGLTEFLPVSSTGHLILAAHGMDLQGEAVKTFEVAIQAGALGAVAGLYRNRMGQLAEGLFGRNTEGWRLLGHLTVSFLPAAVAGVLLHHAIKQHLFGVWPVTAALAAGGAFMIVAGPWLQRRAGWSARPLRDMTAADALVIGLAQCLSLWPGTSRAMVTLVAGMLRGFSPVAAAEYSFLLALPTLGAATCFDLAKGGRELLLGSSALSLVVGFASAAVVAALAIRGFLRTLTRWGLAPFGWYRLAVAALLWALL